MFRCPATCPRENLEAHIQEENSLPYKQQARQFQSRSILTGRADEVPMQFSLNFSSTLFNFFLCVFVHIVGDEWFGDVVSASYEYLERRCMRKTLTLGTSLVRLSASLTRDTCGKNLRSYRQLGDFCCRFPSVWIYSSNDLYRRVLNFCPHPIPRYTFEMENSADD